MTFCFAMDFHYSERIGGAEVQAWLLARELARRGYEVHYLAQSLQGRANEMEVREGVRLHWLKYRGYLLWRNSVSYYRTLRRLDPDVVIQRMTSFNTGVIGLYARRHHKPFAWICTDNSVPERWLFTRKEFAAIVRKKLAGKLKSPFLLCNAIITDLARDWGMRQASHVFTQNDGQFELLRRNYGLCSLRMPSGHELPSCEISAQQRFRNKIILWAGNLGANKRPEKFVELAHALQRHDWRFVMLGGREGTARVENFAAAPPPNLTWLGPKPLEETLSWFDRATVFVNTSKSEGFPNTFIQAWLRGVPVVTLGVDPNQVIIQNCLGHVTGSVAEMAQAIQALLVDESRYDKLSQHVADFAGQHFTISAVADHFLSTIQADATIWHSKSKDALLPAKNGQLSTNLSGSGLGYCGKQLIPRERKPQDV